MRLPATVFVLDTPHTAVLVERLSHRLIDAATGLTFDQRQLASATGLARRPEDDPAYSETRIARRRERLARLVADLHRGEAQVVHIDAELGPSKVLEAMLASLSPG